MNKFNELKEFLEEKSQEFEISILKYSFFQGKKYFNVKIIVENNNNETTIEDCEIIYNLAKLWLKNENLINSTYLYVESPGIERELFTIQDYEKFLNHEVFIEIKEKIDNQKKFKGFIKKVNCDLIFLETTQGTNQFYFNQIKFAKLIANWGEIKKGIK